MEMCAAGCASVGGGAASSAAASEREGALWVDRCGSGTAVASVQHLRGAGGRCVSVGVFCEAGVDARARQTSESPAEVGGWASKGEMEGGKGRELCPGERTVVVKIMVLRTYSLETRRNTMSSPPFLEGGRNYGHPRTTAAQRVCRLVAREIR